MRHKLPELLVKRVPELFSGVMTRVSAETLQKNLKYPLCEQNINNTLCRFAIPQRRDTSLFPVSGKHLLQIGFDIHRISTNQLIRAKRNRFGPFGVIPECHAGDSHYRGLLCNATAVGDDALRTTNEVIKLQIAHWII